MDVNQQADILFNRLDLNSINNANSFELYQAIGVINRLFLTPERAARLDAIRALLQMEINRQNTGRTTPPAAGGRRKSRKNRSY